MPLDDNQLRAIGRISIRFNELEFLVNLFVWALVNSDLDIGRLAFADEPFTRMLNRVKILSEQAFRDNRELRNRIQQWTRQASDVQWRRNEVLHALWLKDEPTDKMVALRLTGKEPREAGTRANQLDQLADYIDSVRREASDLLHFIPAWSQG
jgi:hypothetical protein